MTFVPRSFAGLLCSLVLLVAASEARAVPAVGDVPPPLVGRSLDGEEVSLAAYAGKAIVVSFWATWCPYCLKELPILENIQRAAGKERIQVIAVNTESREVFRKAARTLSSLTLMVAHDASNKASDAYGVKGIPHMVIIGRDGRIVKVYKGYSEDSLDGIAADINRAIAAPLPAEPAASASLTASQ